MMFRASPVVVAALCLGACNPSPMVAPNGTTLRLFANPTFIRADGGVSVISAQLVEPAGTLVPDGTVVQFFSNLGRIDFTGKTKDGVARVNLIGDGHSGTATVSATSGLNGGTGATTSTGASGAGTTTTAAGTVTVTIGSSLPKIVIVTADPAGVRPSQTALITATVYDVDGNAAVSVPITFVLGTGSSSYESLQSGGQPRFTDASGRAFDVLSTVDRSGVSRSVTVNALAPNGVSGLIQVSVY